MQYVVLFFAVDPFAQHRLACIFRIPAPLLLFITNLHTPSWSLPVTSQRCDSHFSRISWPLPAYGSTTSTIEPIVPIHSRPEPCILGSELLGVGYSSRPDPPERFGQTLHLSPTAVAKGCTVVSRGQLGGLSINESGVTSTSRGLVGDTVFAVLPTVKPIHTFAITVAFQTVRLKSVLRLDVQSYSHYRSTWVNCGQTRRTSHS